MIDEAFVFFQKETIGQVAIAAGMEAPVELRNDLVEQLISSWALYDAENDQIAQFAQCRNQVYKNFFFLFSDFLIYFFFI